MFDVVDRGLKAWVEKTLGDIVFSLEPPGRTASGSGVSCYMLELVDAPPNRGMQGPPPLQVHLRYLITTWAETPEEAHGLLGKLMFAAMLEPDFQTEVLPIPAETWAALDARPQPAFMLRVPARHERLMPPVRYVTEPVVIGITPAVSLHGVVLTSRKKPVAGAVVELPAVRRSASTDARGEFVLKNVPGGQETYHLSVRAKGRELSVDVSPSEIEPIQIQFDPIDLE